MSSLRLHGGLVPHLDRIMFLVFVEAHGSQAELRFEGSQQPIR